MSEQARELSSLESKLTSLTPQPSALDRDYILYHAGRASVRQGWFWQAATGFLTIVVAGLGIALLFRPVQRSEPVVVYVPLENPAPVAHARDWFSPPPVADASSSFSIEHRPIVVHEDHWRSDAENLRLRDQIFRFGIESVPQSRSTPVAEKPLPMDPLLGLPANSLDDESSRLLLRSTLHSGF